MTPPDGRQRRLGALRLVRDTSLPAPEGYPTGRVKCGQPETVFQFMEPYVDREEVEVFWILALTVQRKIIMNRPLTVSRGTLTGTLVHPREVFRLAIQANAAGVIAVHNHPSGDPTPSPEDRAITGQLVAAGGILGIPLVDHVVIGGGRYVSFSETGLL